MGKEGHSWIWNLLSTIVPGGIQLPKGHSGYLLSYDPEYTELTLLLHPAQEGGGGEGEGQGRG